MNKVEKSLKKQLYYQRNRDKILWDKRQHNLVWLNRRRKYYRESQSQADMPVDLNMMRNRIKFNEGISLNYE